MVRAPAFPATRFDVAGFGELVSDPSRVAILLALMDGSARPATELADIAGVTRSTASAHLRRLLDGGLVIVDALGRHRYFRLASEAVADALEAVVLLRPPGGGDGRARRARSPRDPALEGARTCYRHLAGRLGVAWLAALESRGLVAMREGALVLSVEAGRVFASAGASIGDAPWPSGKPCLDWTERRYHLGGALGTLLTEQLFAMKWIARRGDGRAVRITAKGAVAFERTFGVRA